MHPDIVNKEFNLIFFFLNINNQLTLTNACIKLKTCFVTLTNLNNANVPRKINQNISTSKLKK